MKPRKTKYSELYEKAYELGYFILPLKSKKLYGDVYDYKVEFIKVDRENRLVDKAGFCTYKLCYTPAGLIEAILKYMKGDKCEMVKDYYYEDLYPNLFK